MKIIVDISKKYNYILNSLEKKYSIVKNIKSENIRCIIMVITLDNFSQKKINEKIKRALKNKQGVVLLLEDVLFQEFQKSSIDSINIPIIAKLNLEFINILSINNNFHKIEEKISKSLDLISLKKDDEINIIEFGKKIQSKSFLKSGVFISHKKNDKEQALKLSNYLNHLEINTYLDKEDKELNENNPHELVKNIKENIKNSDFFICIYSNHTKNSKWVYYEIGLAFAFNKPICFLELEKILEDKERIEFISISEKVNSIITLKEYIVKNYLEETKAAVKNYIDLNDNLLQQIFIEGGKNGNS